MAPGGALIYVSLDLRSRNNPSCSTDTAEARGEMSNVINQWIKGRRWSDQSAQRGQGVEVQFPADIPAQQSHTSACAKALLRWRPFSIIKWDKSGGVEEWAVKSDNCISVALLYGVGSCFCDINMLGYIAAGAAQQLLPWSINRWEISMMSNAGQKHNLLIFIIFIINGMIHKNISLENMSFVGCPWTIVKFLEVIEQEQYKCHSKGLNSLSKTLIHN